MTLIMEHLPQECDHNNLESASENNTGTSESSEAESVTGSSAAEDEDEAWESGWYKCLFYAWRNY